MHTTDTAHGMGRSLFGKVKEGQLVATTHIEENVSGSGVIAILHDSRKPHPQHISIKIDGLFQVRANQGKVIDPDGRHRLRRRRCRRQVMLFYLFSTLLIETPVCHWHSPQCESHEYRGGARIALQRLESRLLPMK